MIYLDYCATTPCLEEVIEAMSPYWNEDYGNPSSAHLFGRKAKAAVERARSQVAKLLNCESSEIIFTSGATESNNLVFLSLLLDQHEKRKRLIVSSIEHKSVLEPAKFLAKRGFELVLLPVNSQGIVDMDAASSLIDKDTALVSVQTANNEIGTIQPIKELAAIAHSVGASFHTDGAQALGKIPFDVHDFNCDMASFSAHKIYGPKGVGALYVRGGVKRWKWELPFHGGGQEYGLRPGTQNVPAIVGFGVASRLAIDRLSLYSDITKQITNNIEDLITTTYPKSVVFGFGAPRVPGIICFSMPSFQSDVLQKACSDFCFSVGSACDSGSIGYSHVLQQLTSNEDLLSSLIRISFNTTLKVESINKLLNCMITNQRSINEMGK